MSLEANAGERRVRTAVEENVVISSKKRKIESSYCAVTVKQERSLSPALALPHSSSSPQLSGVIFVKYPSNCNSSHPGWKANRSQCLQEETARLQALGLNIVRRLIRDDGLAFDWSSGTPIDPITLKPPSLPTETVQASSSSFDLLGHALQDQVSVCQSWESSESLVQPAAPDVTRLMNVDRSTTEIPSGETTEFAIVGAAIKDTAKALSADQQPVSISSSPKEHRRLLPLDLRIYHPSLNGKPGYRLNEPDNRRRRRIAWIGKEVEKIEGYTGEKVANYRYDRNDVIIVMESKTNSSNYRPHLSRPTPIAPFNTLRQQQQQQQIKPKQKQQQQQQQQQQQPRRIPPKSLIVNHFPKRKSLAYDTSITIIRPPASSVQPILPVIEQTPLQSTALPAPSTLQNDSLTERDSSQQSSSTSSSTQINTPVPSAINVPSTAAVKSISNVSATVASNPPRAPSPVISISSDESDGVPSPRSLFSSLERSPTAQQAPSGSENIESRGLRFLEQYLMLYDTNRKDLVSAFTPNATFTWIIDGDRKTKSTKVITGPLAISEAIRKLDEGLHRSIKGNISYDMTPLDDLNPGAMMIICDGTVVPRDHSKPTRSFSRIFILRQNTDHDREVWPLKIATEKLVLKRIL